MEKVVLTGMYLDGIATNLDIVKSRPDQCCMTAGIHPYHATELESANNGSGLRELADRINATLQQQPGAIVAFGELGLDYDRTALAPKDVQVHAFKTQLDLTVKEGWDLPLFLHCRSAFDDFIEILEPYLPSLPRKGLVHSFVGTTEQLNKLLKLGLDISVNGFSFQSQHSLEMVRAMPLERLHLETDAPWGELKNTSELVLRYCKHAPSALQSKKKDKWDAACMVKERNESCMTPRVAFIVAALKGASVDEVANAAWENSNRLFRLST